MKMTKIKHINIVHTKNYEWEVKLSMSDSVSTWIDFVCGDFSYKALYVNSPETSMSGILEKVVGLYFGNECL